MGTIKSLRDLTVWQEGMTLAEAVYRLTARFPAVERYGLASQARRSAVSAPSNIAEGHTRESTREHLQSLSVSQASLAEPQTQVELATRLGYCTTEECAALLERSWSLAKQLHALRNALRRRAASAKPTRSSARSSPQSPIPNPQPQGHP